MKLETRRRVHDDHVNAHYDLVLLVEDESESRLLDKVIGDVVGEEGVIATFEAELRVSDDFKEHYILLKPSAA